MKRNYNVYKVLTIMPVIEKAHNICPLLFFSAINHSPEYSTRK